jgi:hypothetical protein
MSIVERAKDYAIKRSIDVKSSNEGVSLADIERAVNTEFKETRFSRKPTRWKIGSSCSITSRKTSSPSNRFRAVPAKSCNRGVA